MDSIFNNYNIYTIKINTFKNFRIKSLTLIWVGFLGVHFEVGGGEGGEIIPTLPPV